MRCGAGGNRTAGDEKHMETNQKAPRQFLAFGDKKDALAAAALLTAEQPGITYAFSVAVDSRHWDAAHAVGLSRTLIKKLRGQKAWESRGAAEDERIDTEGSLAEILIAMVLEKAGAKVSPLVAHKPDSGGLDVEIGGKALDVKSVGQGKTLININEWTHDRKPAHAYMLVKFARADVADVYVVNYGAVQKPAWQHVTCLRGQALDSGRYYFSCRLPAAGLLEDLPEEAEA